MKLISGAYEPPKERVTLAYARVSLVPRPHPLFNVTRRKGEGLGCDVMHVMPGIEAKVEASVGRTINVRLSCPRVRAVALCATKGVSSRRRVVHRTIDLGERRARFLQITNIPIWNRVR